MADPGPTPDLLARAVDRLFQRLAATYGAAWDRSLGAAPIADVRTVWARELAGFAGRLDALAWALDHLPERCPNVIEFRAIARSAPAPETPRLEAPKADPARVAAEVAKARAAPVERPDPKDWARRILARHAAGEKLYPVSVALARAALGPRRGLALEAV
jgi:hypothetical protein